MALNLAILAGDGIGPEVIGVAVKVMEAAAKSSGLTFTATDLPYGGTHFLKTGNVISDPQVQDLRKFDAILLGAVGHPDVKPGVLEKGLLLKLRFDLDLYINLRPVRLLQGVSSPLANRGPEHINFDVIRENTEDLYCGNGGIARKGTPHEIATQEMIATRFGVDRCLRYAFQLSRAKKAAGAGKGRLTLVHKTNVLTYCGDTWFRAFHEIGQAEFPDIQRDYHHVDACCMYMVARPDLYDTIVVPNMFGDIITDLGAAISGGMGTAASGNLNPDGAAPSMFEPVHGSAPDIAGQNKANPVAAVISAAMLLRETGRIRGEKSALDAADRIDAAVRQVCPQFAGQPFDRLPIGTTQVGDLILKALE
jgi:3-isopropylmalate dehydrogenase